MNKKIIGKVVAAVLVAGMVPAIASCGGDIASQGNGEPQISEQSFEEGSGQIYDSTVSDIIASDDATPQDDQGITADEPSNDILEVIVKDDKHADFVFYGYGGESISDITVLDISYDRYTASFNSFMNNDCNVWNGEDNGKMTLCEGGKAGYTIENEKITITVDMSGVSGFSFDNVSGDCVIHYEHGENGGPNMTLTWEDVANMDNYVSASQVAQSDTNNTSDNKDDIGSYNGTNATSQINSILSQAAGDYGSFKLVDYGNGTYALVDINYTYQQRVGEPPNYTWVENGFQGQSSLFGDGLGAEDMGDGVFVEVNLTLEREYRVVINKDGAIAFYGVDGGGMDFPRID